MKNKEKERKVICLPDIGEYPDMDVGELMKYKKKVEVIADVIARLIRKKIQR